jgi:DNA-binding CsgD family transcriptional regulator
MTEFGDEVEPLGLLTDKQRAVMDLVLEHKSSKEIARALSISPFTVDQRISAVRQKLGGSSRGEAARAYAKAKSICGESAYGFSHVDSASIFAEDLGRDAPPDPVLTLSDVSLIELRAPWQDGHLGKSGLEALDNRFGIFGRIAVIIGLSGLIALMFLAMVSIAQTLTKLV